MPDGTQDLWGGGLSGAQADPFAAQADSDSQATLSASVVINAQCIADIDTEGSLLGTLITGGEAGLWGQDLYGSTGVIAASALADSHSEASLAPSIVIYGLCVADIDTEGTMRLTQVALPAPDPNALRISGGSRWAVTLN